MTENFRIQYYKVFVKNAKYCPLPHSSLILQEDFGDTPPPTTRKMICVHLSRGGCPQICSWVPSSCTVPAPVFFLAQATVGKAARCWETAQQVGRQARVLQALSGPLPLPSRQMALCSRAVPDHHKSNTTGNRVCHTCLPLCLYSLGRRDGKFHGMGKRENVPGGIFT